MNATRQFSKRRIFLVVGVLAVCFFVWILNSEQAIAQTILKTFGFENVGSEIPKKQNASEIAKKRASHDIQGDSAASVQIPADMPDSSMSKVQPDLRTREGRQAFHDDLAKQKSYDIWVGWDDVISRRDPDELGVFITAMGDALRRDGSPDVYAQMAKRLLQSNLSLQDRLYVTGALERAATREAVQVLLNFAQAVESRTVSNGDSAANLQTLQRGALQAVQLASKEFINGSRNWEISSPLENAWRNLGTAEAESMRTTISQSIVYLGKPEGLEVLISTVDQGNLPATARGIVLSSIAQLESNDAVPLIGKKLNQSTPGSATTSSDLNEALAKGLLSVGSADAMRELVAYLNGASINQATRERFLLILRSGNLSGEALRVMKEAKLK